jgi:hypothetical protein
VTKTAQEAGIRFPVFITRGVYEQCVAVPPGVTGQDEADRVWDLVWMLRFAIIRSKPGTTRLPPWPKFRALRALSFPAPLGLTPAQTRAKGSPPLDSASPLRLASTLTRLFLLEKS